MMRVGIGFDVHPLTPGRDLILGGVQIPHSVGLAGHSDADVLCHAIADAILGAAASGDLGTWFPSTDESLRDRSSLELLRQVVERTTAEGWSLGNLDTVIIAQGPRLAPYINLMRGALAACLGIPLGAVSVKATTTDRLGAVGRAEGIAAQAIVLLHRSGGADSSTP
jgi:2-C-methyl-D-erythritol 2,4-cyclodiphosphate synthase